MIFDNNDIYNLYNKHIVKSKKYFDKFRHIDKYLSKDELEIFKNTDPPRVVSIIDFKEWIEKYSLKNGNNLLSTCNSDPELSYLSYKNKTDIPYPPYDLHTLDLETKNYDFIIFNQTIEHLYNPFLCLKNLYDHLNNGGFLYTSVPTINIPHMTPIHFWGVTPIGLCLLMKSVGFQILECGYWGSQKYIEYIFKKNKWPGYNDISNNYDLEYDAVCQAQTWILVRK